MFSQVTFEFAVRIGRVPVQQLIDQYPEGPDVGFGAIDAMDVPFRRHVKRGTDI